MPRHLLTHIDAWSVARTVFPLAWAVSAMMLFLVYLLAGSLLMNLASDYYDVPAGAGSVGIFAALLASIITGFIYSIFATLFTVLASGGYNLLAQVGGGFAFSSRPLEELKSSLGDGRVAAAEVVTVPGNIKHTDSDEGGDRGD